MYVIFKVWVCMYAAFRQLLISYGIAEFSAISLAWSSIQTLTCFDFAFLI